MRPFPLALAASLVIASCGGNVSTPLGTTIRGQGGATGTLTTGTGGTGGAGDGVYRAVSLFTGVPRFAIFKASPAEQLCYRLLIEPSMGGASAIEGDGWGVYSAEITTDLQDCDAEPGWPPPALGDSMTFSPVQGSGALAFEPMVPECSAGIHAEVFFPGAPEWAPPGASFDIDLLPIEGGCP